MVVSRRIGPTGKIPGAVFVQSRDRAHRISLDAVLGLHGRFPWSCRSRYRRPGSLEIHVYRLAVALFTLAMVSFSAETVWLCRRESYGRVTRHQVG